MFVARRGVEPLSVGSRVRRCAVAILTDCRRLKTNKYLCMMYFKLCLYFVNAPPSNGSRNTATPSNEKSTTHTETTATAAMMYIVIFFIIFFFLVYVKTLISDTL